MLIKELHLHTRELEAQRRFFSQHFGLSSQPNVIHERAAILNDSFRSPIVDFLRLAA
jgi:catechol-2,3-dioxygenase